MLLYKWIMIRYDIFGGEEGLAGLDWLMETSAGNYYFSGIFMLVVIFFLFFFSKSSFGLILRSIGENETASEGSGINTTYYKIVAFMISAGIAGIGGLMLGFKQVEVSSANFVYGASLAILATDTAEGALDVE